MPFDSNGIATVTRTIAVTGQTIQATQVNVPFADIQAMLSSTMLRTGIGQATGDINFGGFRAINLADATNPNDAVTKQQLDGTTTRGYIFGLIISNNSVDGANDIDISPGSAASDDIAPVVVVLQGGLTKRLDAVWSAGSGNGGLDTGAVANGNYHVWLIQRSDTGGVDILFSLSASSPTMPANYDRKRRIASTRRESGSIITFSQIGDVFLRVPINDFITASTISPSPFTLSVPNGIIVQPLMAVQVEVSNAGDGYLLMGNGGDSAGLTVIVARARTSSPGVVSADCFIGGGMLTDFSGRLVLGTSVTGSVSVLVSTKGWVDTRGRFS